MLTQKDIHALYASKLKKLVVEKSMHSMLRNLKIWLWE